jgi:hypothetical protein
MLQSTWADSLQLCDVIVLTGSDGSDDAVVSPSNQPRPRLGSSFPQIYAKRERCDALAAEFDDRPTFRVKLHLYCLIALPPTSQCLNPLRTTGLGNE